MKTVSLDFDRDNAGQIYFNERNLKLLEEYVIPIIEKNRGWSTEHITKADFFKDPEKYRGDIDATVECDLNAKVFTAIEDNSPVGLLEYVSEDLTKSSNSDFQNILSSLRGKTKSPFWEKLIDLGILDRTAVDKFSGYFNDFVEGKLLYKDVGVVLLPDLQGKKSGISDDLYKLMRGGFIEGWTSSPLVIAKRRKIYSSTVMFPRFGEQPENIEEFSCITLGSAKILSTGIPEGFNFGVKALESFALRDKGEYLSLAKEFLEAHKISELDYKRLDYTLDFARGQALIMSYSK